MGLLQGGIVLTFRGLRIPMIVAVLVGTLALLLGATHLYRRQSEVNPLIRRSQAVAGVTGASLRRTGGLAVVEVELAAVEDLRLTYRQLEAVAHELVPPDTLRLVLGDRRTPELNEAYHQVHHVIHEAAARGTFSELIAVEDRLRERGYRVRLSVDERFVYVQIHDQADGYLYELVPRPLAGGRDGT
jgi:hypothetical protein